LRYDNSPYGQIIPEVKKNVTKHPYRWTTIGSMDHLDAAKLEDFKTSIRNVPNNAVLVVVETLTQLKLEWIQKYFGSIKKELIERETLRRTITETIKAKFEDTNIQIPMVVAARTPSMKTVMPEF
jgi:predicted Zn-dependent peptidase